MKSIVSLIFISISIFTLAQTQWANGYGGNDQDVCRAVTTDDLNNIYITGSFTDTIDFDPSPSSDIHISSFSASLNSSNTNIFIQKLDPNGNVIWTKTIGGNKQSWGRNIELDDQGNVYVTGFYIDTVDFDPGLGVFELVSNGSQLNTFILKLNNLGEFEWVKTVGGDSHNWDTYVAPDIKIVGNELILISLFAGTGDLDPGAGVEMYDSGGSDFPIIVKFNLNGDYIWSKLLESNAQQASFAMFVESDAADNLYITGRYKDTVDFDPGPLVNNVTSAAGAKDIFLLKLNNLGDFIWVKTLESNSSAQPTTLQRTSNNKMCLAGLFAGDLDFDTGVGQNNITSINGAHFICEVDTAGTIYIPKLIAEGQLSGSIIRGAEVSETGDIFLVGYSYGELVFDPIINPMSFLFDDAGGFILTLDSTLEFKALDLFNSVMATGYVEVSCISEDFDGNLIYSLGYQSDIDVDIQGSSTIFNSNGNLDFLVVKAIDIAGIEDDFIENSDVYPNPSRGIIFIKLKYDLEKLEILSTKGEVVNVDYMVDNNVLSVQGIPKGSYLIQLTFENGFSQVRKLLVE